MSKKSKKVQRKENTSTSTEDANEYERWIEREKRTEKKTKTIADPFIFTSQHRAPYAGCVYTVHILLWCA